MQWEILIIPLIALGVWIMGTLFKSEDDKTKQGARGRGNVPNRGPSRRPGTNFERFLEEARRRREAEDRPKAAPAPPPPRPRVSRPPLRERPPQPREAPPLIRPKEVPIAVPVAQPIAPPPSVEPVAVAPQAGGDAIPAVPTIARDLRPSPIVQQVHSLLSKPQTAATAFVLREILDRPLCKRRR
jgi:hypothetical protein